jgi:tricorn protease
MTLQRISMLAACLAFAGAAGAQGTRLLRHPTVSRELVAFAYAGDLWTVPRTGGQARRITATPGMEGDAYFSPDGSQIAFTATVGGNSDVYVVSSAGGQPKRLTWHPGLDRVRGWTPDGKRIIFASTRSSVPQESYFRLWSIGLEGGLPEAMPMPRAFQASYAADSRRLAYQQITQSFMPGWDETSRWRRYRGGRTEPIRILNLADYSEEKLPWTNSNDSDPMWVGNTIYFLSDRNGAVNLYSGKPGAKEVVQLTHHDDFDIMNASAGPDAIVYEQAGYIHLFDPKSGQSRQLSIEVTGDLPWTRPQFKKVSNMIRESALSPTGVRAAFEARGDIFTIPAEKGDYRNLTQSPGAHDHSPVWSPDGWQLAWLSDASGEYQLMIGDPTGATKPRAIALPSTAYFSAPQWSPDGKYMLLQDNHLNLWTIELGSGQAAKIETDLYADPGRQFDAAWSPDSRWVIYSKSLHSHLRAIFVYSMEEKKAHQITDGMADAVSPAFDAGGKYVYFLASTDYGPQTGWLEMSSLDRPVKRSIYLGVLSAGDPSPLLPEAGDEPRAAEEGAAKTKPDAKGVTVRIDFEGIAQRLLSLNVPPGDYSRLSAGQAGSIFYLEAAASGAPGAMRLQRYQLKDRAAAPFLEGIRSYSLSGDRKKLLYQAGGGPEGRWGVVPVDRPAKVGDGQMNVGQLEMHIDPRAEWAEIFRETWRIQREYFYDPKMHGNDWQAIYKKYLPLVAYVGHRADLGYLIAMVGGELTVGHSYLSGAGDEPTDEKVAFGLLGADYTVENGRYRIARIYTGENWNPELRAPLAAPGIQAAPGDYILEVNGRPVAPPTSIYSMFEGTVGHQVSLRLNNSPSLEGSRLVTVVPLASEDALRTRAWVEENRRLVDKLSNGRLAYVWLPNTGAAGYQSFTRYYFSQQDKEGAVIDERYNHGGMVADYLVNEMDRKLMGFFAQRDGQPNTSPTAGIYGPKVMVINESAGSGGDALPFYFRVRKIGPLVGTRTWGGLVGTLGTPSTIDGGGITAPSLAFYNLEGKWDVENVGVAPDIAVENTTAEAMKGHDAQLERAVEEALKMLSQNASKKMPRPASIDRVSK